jgi:hypothetical protein
VKVQSGTNPFTCIGCRRGGNFYPVCFDEDGTRTILPAFADDAVFRMKGSTEQEIEQKLAEGFAQGRYRLPSEVASGRQGQVRSVPGCLDSGGSLLRDKSNTSGGFGRNPLISERGRGDRSPAKTPNVRPNKSDRHPNSTWRSVMAPVGSTFLGLALRQRVRFLQPGIAVWHDGRVKYDGQSI